MGVWSDFRKFLEDGAFFNQNGFKPAWFVYVVQLWSLLQAFILPAAQTLAGLFALRVAAGVLSRLRPFCRLAAHHLPSLNSLWNDRHNGLPLGTDAVALRKRGAVTDRAAALEPLGAKLAHSRAENAGRCDTVACEAGGAPRNETCIARCRSFLVELRRKPQLGWPRLLYRVLQLLIVLRGLMLFKHLALTNEPRTYFYSTSIVPPPLCPLNDLEPLIAKESRFLQVELPRYVAQVQEALWQDARRYGEPGIRKHRIVLYRASCDGLGNRLTGLVSAFYYAYMSQRAFLVDWNGCAAVVSGTLEDLVDPPFAWSARDLLRVLGADDRQHAARRSDQDTDPVLVEFQRIFGDAGVRRLSTAYCRPCPERRPLRDLEHMLCERFVDDSTPVVDFYGTHWTGATIQHNPYFRTASCKLFGNDAFGILSRALLRPNAVVQRIAAPVLEEVSRAVLTIALQIRRRDSYGISAAMEEVMWRCAQQIRVLHFQRRTLGDRSNKASTPGHSTGRNESGIGNQTFYRTLLFIAADNDRSRKRIEDGSSKEHTGLHAIYLSSPLTKTELVGIQYAFAEMYLLSKADEIIISPYSSFGSFTHGWSSKVPWIALRSGKCMQTTSSMPCDVYWFGVQRLSCFNASMLSSEMVNMDSCYG
jgi:hypothetical protein